MIKKFDEFITEKKKGVRTFRFVDNKGNELTDINDEYANIDPDTVDLKTFANDIFTSCKNVYSVIVQEISFSNDEAVEKFEVNRTNPEKVLEF